MLMRGAVLSAVREEEALATVEEETAIVEGACCPTKTKRSVFGFAFRKRGLRMSSHTLGGGRGGLASSAAQLLLRRFADGSDCATNAHTRSCTGAQSAGEERDAVMT